ncbi:MULTISPECIES: hypothetical protein [Mycobacterium]|uniref:Gamma-glutamylcyclotransferase n=3 Tax=Mycobacterium kiyosense TaxID=2871094 RepID=A0A9P3Q4A1_9MYCO|nr:MULTISPECIES: hypothetical protein [Mycobacterium]GLB86911.1 hypothetical protein SRL2020028_61670 [Mycobacterium kiyosense]GLB93630.1 hypothetical protein SRL2020226_04060 [Mycobacterium kiyosense]GLC05274.1 hypothetical protein SRL2020400_58650 [Mycobacterium kiyosense]GLC11258.1 hypothetical protein SRL2020411_59040 [Mycobacterium kiyosense]GLC23355.1 hypothetical protein SRL2020472_59260 [Mycobacterium kiyosense]
MNLPEHEERYIRDYVNSQSPDDDQAGLVQKIGSRRVLGRTHETYDVHCTSTRWWVITNPTNLYLQTDFPQAEQALIFHIGLGAMIAERSRSEIDSEDEVHVSTSWRRYRQAVLAMNEATEAEDYQAVGIKCRDALIAMAKGQVDAEWLGEVAEPPKAADFKAWANIYADRLADGRMRSYVKALSEKTWDLTVWLQHFSNATEFDADIVLGATAHLLSTFGKLIRRTESDEPERCPRCESYKLAEDIEPDDSGEGFYESIVCSACDWRSEPTYTSWAEHLKDADIEGYLSGPGSVCATGCTMTTTMTRSDSEAGNGGDTPTDPALGRQPQHLGPPRV